MSDSLLPPLPGHPETAAKDTSCFCAACVAASRVDSVADAVHVLPNGDVVGHEVAGGALCDCVCGPDVERVDGGVLVVHHSLDGREASE